MERCGRITAENCRNNNNNHHKGKEPWMYNQVGRGGHLCSGLIASWPPRSYYCSFCKREFKSAQALGGHMNVHRRDKARLRQSPPLGPLRFVLHPNPNLGSKPIPYSSSNPTTNLNLPPPSSSRNKHSLVTNALPSMTSPLAQFFCSLFSVSKSDDLKAIEAVKAVSGYAEFKDLKEGDSSNELQNGREVVRLDLEMGIPGDHKEDLDLELRLGYI